MKKYTESHEWIEVDQGVGVVGITHHAQESLGEIVYVELPEVGKSIHAGSEASVLESTKAAVDVYAPVSGAIIEVNEKLKEQAELVNQAAETDGWLFKIKLSNPDELKLLMDQPS